MNNKVQDKKERWLALAKKIGDAKNSFVTIGFQAPGGDEKHPEKNSRASVSEIAFYHEFGAAGAGIPERSFIRSSFDANIENLNKRKDDLITEILLDRLEPKNALNSLGFMMQEIIKNKINTSNMWAKKLKPRTIKRKAKGSLRAPDHPLIDSGLMLRSVSFKFHEK